MAETAAEYAGELSTRSRAQRGLHKEHIRVICDGVEYNNLTRAVVEKGLDKAKYRHKINRKLKEKGACMVKDAHGNEVMFKFAPPLADIEVA